MDQQVLASAQEQKVKKGSGLAFRQIRKKEIVEMQDLTPEFGFRLKCSCEKARQLTTDV